MIVLITKAFQNTSDTVLYPFEILNLWDTTAERAIKEGKAVAVPEGMDPQNFKMNYLNNINKKKGK